MGREDTGVASHPQEWVWDQRLGGHDKPQEERTQDHCEVELIRQRKAVETRGGFKQDWPERILFIMAVVWFGLSPTGHLQTLAADSWKPAWV